MNVIEAYRTEQVEMLRAELRQAQEKIVRLEAEQEMLVTRCETAEERLRILREEIREARRTPFD